MSRRGDEHGRKKQHRGVVVQVEVAFQQQSGLGFSLRQWWLQLDLVGLAVGFFPRAGLIQRFPALSWL